MTYPSLRILLFGLSALAGTTSASVSLASFIPRIEKLPEPCATVYNSRIEGCTADDFKPGATCTATCVQGLVKLAEAVNSNCADVDVGETSIIGVFQNGIGIQALCPGVTVTTVSSSSSTTRVTSQTSTRAATTTTSTETEEDEPSSTSSGGLIIDPSATGTLETTVNTQPTNTAQLGASSTRSNSAAQSSLVPNSQLSNADSGGGSPFDVTATGSSPQLRAWESTLAALVATALVFVACA